MDEVNLIQDYNYNNYGIYKLEELKPNCPECVHKKNEYNTVDYDEYDNPIHQKLTLVEATFSSSINNESEVDSIWYCDQCKKTFKGRSQAVANMLSSTGFTTPDFAQEQVDNLKISDINSNIELDQKINDKVNWKIVEVQNEIDVLKETIRKLTEDPIVCIKLSVLNFKLKY